MNRLSLDGSTILLEHLMSQKQTGMTIKITYKDCGVKKKLLTYNLVLLGEKNIC